MDPRGLEQGVSEDGGQLRPRHVQALTSVFVARCLEGNLQRRRGGVEDEVLPVVGGEDGEWVHVEDGLAYFACFGVGLVEGWGWGDGEDFVVLFADGDVGCWRVAASLVCCCYGVAASPDLKTKLARETREASKRHLG